MVAGCDGGDGVEVEVGEPFEARELGFGDAAGPAPFAAVVDLGGEDLGEERQVGLAFAGGDLGQPGGFGADGGQVQLAGGGADARPARLRRRCVAVLAPWLGGHACSRAAGRAGRRSRSGSGRAGRSGPAPRSAITGGELGVVAAGVDEHDLRVEQCRRRRPGPSPRSAPAAGRVRWASRISISARVPAASPRRSAGGVPIAWCAAVNAPARLGLGQRGGAGQRRPA